MTSEPPQSSSVRILHTGDGVAVAEIGAVCVVIWRDAVIMRRFERQAAGLSEVVNNNPQGAGFLCVVEPSATPPDDKLRRASINMVTSHGDNLKCVACVIEGTGFRAAVGRSVLSGMTLVSGQRKSPLSIFSSITAAARWMGRYVKLEQFVFADSVESVRRTLEPFNA